MSSAYQKANGSHEIAYFFRNPQTAERKRYKLRLGNCDIETRDSIKSFLDKLVFCRENGLALPLDLKLWLRELDGPVREQIAKHGLCREKVNVTVKELCDFHLARLKKRKKSTGTIVNVTCATTNLQNHFGPDRKIRSITMDEVEEFRSWLLEHGKFDGGPLAPATASRRCRRAREIFRTAIKEKWLRRGRNPFREMGDWNESNHERNIYIPWDEVLSVLAWCRCPRMRFFLAITRLCGIRSPSDVRPLLWSNFDIHLNIIRVKSTKNKRHRPTRNIPLFKELKPFYDAAYFAAPDGVDEIFFDMPKTDTAITNRLEGYCRKAGIALWVKPMTNLRASGERDMWRVLQYDEVTSILDHSAKVAQEHYFRFANDLKARAEGRALVLPDLSW